MRTAVVLIWYNSSIDTMGVVVWQIYRSTVWVKSSARC